MKSAEIRNIFLNFFREKQHQIVPSAPMVIKNDPTLMFTNAGMNQFKEFFLGNQQSKYKRIADTQKCLRVSGKHNDLEEVGVDTYHHTMFEMLGNWSIGDYFKKDAIAWAWELLTEVYKIDKNNLYITVFEGNEADGVPFDEEAYNEWKKWLPEARILKGNKKDNFWEMGETGPCGPCSEIHIDLRSQAEKDKISGAELVNKDHPRVIEIWNLVFMQFNRNADGKLNKLPAQHVDTGMGFERLCMVLQKKNSNYDTDVFSPLITTLEKICNKKYTATQDKNDIAFRVIVDHIRAITFAIADGQLPSNTGAGYVIRRILRRAVRYGYSFLDLKEAFMYHLVDTLIAQMGDFFTEIEKQKELIENVIKEEEESFLRTLEQGISRFNKYIETKNNKTIEGTFAFELYDTFGFPIDLTQLLSKENDYEVDMKSFGICLKEQKERSRKATKTETGDWVVVHKAEKEIFVGYDLLTAKIRITRYREVKQKGKQLFQLVFDQTPFYPQGGGQVGDTGFIKSGENKCNIIDTQKENNLIVHFVEALPANIEAEFEAQVDSTKRQATACNHTATHLLHFALRETLGKHVAQKGSLVNAEHLRFDFSHFQKMSDEELSKVESRVNDLISQALELEEEREALKENAEKMGAMMLFGEKYGEKVRVIKFGDSIELCGGTHILNTARIGIFKIVSESSVAAGIRRIEAVTSIGAMNYLNEKINKLSAIDTLLKNPPDTIKAIEHLVKQNGNLQKEITKLQQVQSKDLKKELAAGIVKKDNINCIIKKVAADADTIKDIAMQLRKEINRLYLVLASAANDKALLTIAISDDLVDNETMNAGKIIRELAKEIKGGGGGQPFFATAGGSDVAGIENVLKKGWEII